jgi:4-hydroxy-tetrahydrodipicolinate synthase
LRACKTLFMEGGVIKSDFVRHPQRPLTDRTRWRLLQLVRDLDVLALS